MYEAFDIPHFLSGAILVLLSLIIVFGGIQRIAKVSSVIVPFMAIGYFILALVVIILNYNLIPHVFKLIIDSAFGLHQFAGGAIGKREPICCMLR